jgi:hypothetical protein
MSKLNVSFKVLVFLFICLNQAKAITRTSVAGSFLWTNPAAWNGGVTIPASGDDVVIASGSDITMVNGQTCASLTITGTLTGAVGTLTVNGNVSGAGTISSSAVTHIISLTGNWSFNGTSNTSSGGPRVNFTGTASQALSGVINTDGSGGYLYIDKTSGAVTLGSAMFASTFNLNAGTFDASTFLLTAATRTFTAGRIRIGGANGYISNFSGTITQPSGSTIEYYSTANNDKYLMAASHGGNIEITGGNNIWYWGDYSYIVSGNLTITESTNNIALNPLGIVNGNFTVNTTGSVTTTITDGFGTADPINIGGNFILSGTSNVTFEASSIPSAAINVSGIFTINNNTTLKTAHFASLFVTGTAYVATSGKLILNSNNDATTYTLPNLIVDGALEIEGIGSKIITQPMLINGTAVITNGPDDAAGNNVFQGAITIGSAGAFTMEGTSGWYGNTFSDIINNGTFAEPNGVSGVGPITFTGNLINNGTYTANPTPDGFGGNTFTGTSATISGDNPIVIPKVIITGTITNSGTFEVTQSLSGAGSLIQDFDATLIVGGTFTTTNFDATRNGNTVEYNGTSAQTVRDATYQNLELSNTSSTGATLGSSTTVLGNITFENGILTLDNNNLFMDEDVIGAGPTKYIATTGTGRLIRTVGSTPVLFAVGTATTYNPVTLTNTGTEDNFGVIVSTTSPSGPNDGNKVVTMYWNINEVTSTGSNLTVKPGWFDAEEGANFDAGTNVKLGYYNGAAWTVVASSETNASNANASVLSEASGAFNLSVKNITAGVTFAVGKDDGIIATTTPTIVGDATSLDYSTSCINTTTDLAYSVTGYNLTNDIIVTPPTGFAVSTTSGSGFGSSVTLTPSGGYVGVTPIYVRFSPNLVQTYDGSITNASTGATTVNTALTGSGVSTVPTAANTPTADIQSETSLLVTGDITSLGCANATVTERGFYYSTTSGFTPPGTGTKVSETAGAPFAAGSFSLPVDLSTLTTNTIYYFKTFATNAYGSAYSATEGAFTTQSEVLYAISNNGVWTTNGTWSATRGGSSSGTIPAAATVVYIPGGVNVIANTGTLDAKIIIVETGGTLTIQGAATFTAGIPIQIAGTVQSDIAAFPSGTTTVLSGGHYIHNVDGSAIPTATWASTSICDIRGVVGSALTGLDQTFGHVIWNCTGQTVTNMDFPNTGTMTILGDLTITNTGSGSIELNEEALSVNDFTQSGGIFGFGITGTLSVLDDVSLTGGTLDLGISGAFIGTLNIAGDLSYTSGSTITESSSQYGAVHFNGTALQTVTGGGTISNDIRFSVDNNAKVDLGAYSISGSTGTFTINPSATLYTKHASGFSNTASTGAIQVSSSKYFSPTATYIYNGSSAQVTGNAFQNSGAKKIVVNNTAGVTASSAFTISDSLVIGDGVSNAVFNDGGNQITSSGTLIVTSGGKLQLGGATATTVPAFSSGSLASGTTVEYAADVAQSVAALSVPYQNLSFSGTGQKNVSGTISVANDLATTGGLASLGSAVVTLTGNATGDGDISITDGSLTISGDLNATGDITMGSGTLNLAGDWASPGTLTPGTGTVNYTASSGSQTIAGVVYHNLGVAHTSSTNTLGGDASVDGALTFAASGSGKITIGAHTLSLNGTLANHTANKCFISNGATSNISIGGSGVLGSSLYLDQITPGTTNMLHDLTYNRSGETITLGDTIEIIGTITPTAGTLVTGHKLKLVSNASGTARVATGPSNNYISGEVVAEKHIPAFARRWRFFSPPVSGATLQDLKNEMYITGTGGAANGFDATISNQAGIYTYNEAITTGNLNTGWTAANNITNSLVVGRGVRIFIRGDRSDPGRLDGTVTDQNAVVVNLNGPLNMGDITMPVTYSSSGNDANDGWNFVGNPYASPYDWDAFFDAYSGTANCFNIDPTIYIYNPNGDGYISFNAFGGEPGIGDLTDGIIPTIAGFWVKATGANPTLVLTEQYKVATVPAPVFGKTNQNEGFKIRLEKDSISYDDVLVKYMNGATVNSDPYDIIKLSSTWTNISAYGNDNIQLTASVRPLMNANDTIKLSINANATGSYKMKFYNSTNLPIGENVYLIDNYLNTVTDIKTTPVYPITIDYSASGNGTYGLNRFYIVAGTSTPVPVKWLLFTAKQKGANQVGLNWGTAQETNNAGFQIERSEDGRNYTEIGEVEGNGSSQKINNYVFTDTKPNRINYYRIKQTDLDGKTNYSEIRKVEIGKSSLAGLQMYPIPAKDELTINHTQLIKEVKVYNAMGKLELTQTATADNIQLNLQALTPGIYIVEIKTESGDIIQEKFIKE